MLTAPDSFEAESFKLLRAQILFAKDRERPRTIMVTSAMPGDGKTFVAANLAASIAMGIDDYVLLVDCDLRRANLHQMFGLSNRKGLHEYLNKEKELPELLIKTSIKKLSFLPAGSTPRNPSELLASSDMKAFLEEVRDRYDDRYIILDTPPSQILAESNIISNFVDGVVFVVRENVTPSDMVQKAVSSFSKDKLLGIVVNGHTQLQKKHAYYYKNYYQ
jgi:exopolysaccharide/PEP-CTERM locus tyrosine autokinase